MPPNIASPGFAYPASRMSAATSDWPILGTDVNDDWWREASSIANRSWHLWRSNPYARAMVETMLEGALGANGLTPRSTYAAADSGQPASDPGQQAALAAARAKRVQIESSLTQAYAGTRFDAVGQLTRREMSVVMAVSMMVAGDAFAIRQWKPNRPGRQYQATCWRIIDPSRVSNPNFGVNSATQFEGVKLDDDGCPVGIWVQRRNPYAIQVVDYTWDYVPFYADDGAPNVVHLKAPGRPDQIRGIGWLAPVMGLVNQLGNVTDAYVVAKRVQACVGLVITTRDPSASATADRQSSTVTGTGKIYPGMIRYEQEGSTVSALDWGFQGGDHAQFQDSMLQAITAAWGLPMEYVQHRLTKSNMASARAALMQAYRTFQTLQEMMIAHVEQPWAESVITEDIARGRLPFDASDPQVMSFRFNRPPKQFPDPVREATAAKMMASIGKSPSSIFAEQGLDYQDEIPQSHQDATYAAANGVTLDFSSGKTAPGDTSGQQNGTDDSVDGQPVSVQGDGGKAQS